MKALRAISASLGNNLVAILRRSAGYKLLRRKQPAAASRHDYAVWIKLYSDIRPAERSRLAELQAHIPGRSKISVLIDAAGTTPAEIEASIGSVRDQIYDNWEIIVVSAAQDFITDPRDETIQIIADDGRSDRPRLQTALQFATGDIVALLDAGDELFSAALMAIAWTFSHQPLTVALYSDEDIIDEQGVRSGPWFKGDWSADCVLAQAYALRLGAFRRESLVGADIPASTSLTADFYAAWVSLATRGIRAVVHLPYILYHRRQRARDVEPEEFTKVVRRGVQSDIKVQRIGEFGWRRVIRPITEPLPRISLCVPTRDRVELLSACIDGLLHRTAWSNLEVIVIDNGSAEQKTLDYLKTISGDDRVKVLRHEGEFNFSELNNLGASHASGTLFGLMNNDLVVRHPDWLREMASHALRLEVGAVGALLYYGDDTVQHAGVVLGIGGVASHIHKRLPRGNSGYHGRTAIVQDVSCVTGACLLTRLDLYRALGGLDQTVFPIAYNDVDFCLKVISKGLRVILTPDAQLSHLESISRGLDGQGAKRARLERDKALMIERWGHLLVADPFYSPNLSLEATDCRLAWPAREGWPWAE